MIKAFLFDIGNVLIHFNHQKAIDLIADLCDVPSDVVKRELFDSGLEWSYEEGKISTEELHREFERRIERKIEAEDLARALCSIFWANEAMVPVIQSLKRQGYRLVLLSNTSPLHFNYCFEHYPVLQLFDGRALSYQVKACKPDERIFKKALSEAGVAPEHCFYTDDVQDYVTAARRHGIRAEIFVGSEPLRDLLLARGITI